MKKKLVWIIGAVVVVTFMSLNVFIPTKNGNSIFPSINLSKISVEAQSGTCCPEYNSWCIIGAIEMWSYYYKSSGSCHGDHQIS